VPSGQGGFQVFFQISGESRPAVVAAVRVDAARDFDQGFGFEVGIGSGLADSYESISTRKWGQASRRHTFLALMP